MAHFEGVPNTISHPKKLGAPRPPWGDMNFQNLTPQKRPKIEKKFFPANSLSYEKLMKWPFIDPCKVYFMTAKIFGKS